MLRATNTGIVPSPSACSMLVGVGVILYAVVCHTGASADGAGDLVMAEGWQIKQPASNATVNTTRVFIEWKSTNHTRYQVRANRLNDPAAGIRWDSGGVASTRNYAWAGPLPQSATNFLFVRLGNSNSDEWGPWSATGRWIRVDTNFVSGVPNLVRIEGHSLSDNSGPFLGLGASYFQALRRAKFDRSRLTNDLAFLASKKFNYVRLLSMVGWHEAWHGREIAPVSFQNRAGTPVAAWTDYWQQFRDLVDIMYRHGLRAQVTIFADAQLMPEKTDRIGHMRTMLEHLVGREHKVILLEVANEAWQNGFPGPQGVADLREFTRFLADRTSIPVAITSNHETGDTELVALHSGSGADIATFHFSRDRRSAEGGWLPVRDCYRVGILPGLPPFSSNEPIGPGSSVASENDPIKLVMAAAFAWTANLPMYVFHSSAGVFGHQPFQTMAGVGDYQHLQNILPSDLPSWLRHDGRETGAPFTSFANGQANKWWTEVPNPTNGVVCNTGATKAGEFVTLPIGIMDGGVTLQARRPMQCRVYNPITGTVVTNLMLDAGQEVLLPRGPGAYMIRGAFRDAGGSSVPQ